MKEYIEYNKEDKLYKCKKCDTYFKDLSNLKRHLNRKKSCILKTEYKCEKCLKVFNNLYNYRVHINRKTNCLNDINAPYKTIINNNQEEKINIKQVNINEDIDNTGYIYLMVSEVHPNFFKIGRASDMKIREKNLRKDNTYKTYQLRTIMYFYVDNYFDKEKEIHDIFKDYRFCKRNGYNCDTELFIINDKETFIKNFQNMFNNIIT
jgi:hypothetical protein